VYPVVLLIYFISAAVILLAWCSIMCSIIISIYGKSCDWYLFSPVLV
jgi:hypothetical protein